MGDLNVYSNGDGNEDQYGTYGLNYECVELATRWSQIRFGEYAWDWHIYYAYQMWDRGPYLNVPFQQLPNGGATPPQFGDLLIFNHTASNVTGHVAVVSGVGQGYVDIVEQNFNNLYPTGHARLPINGTSIPDRYGLPIIGWLRASNATPGDPGPQGPGGLTLDGFGAVHPFGSATAVPVAAQWPGWDITRGLVRIPSTNGGYVLDAFGGLHPWGTASYSVTTTEYWKGWAIARAMAIRSDGTGGYVLDGWGGLHPFSVNGGPMPRPPSISGYWPGWDIARAIVLLPNSDAGYVLDGWGGLHPFNGAPPLSVGAYWPGWDIARGLVLRPDGTSGYVVDGWNGLHVVGPAPPLQPSAYFPGQDIARGITMIDAGGGYTLTAWGRVRSFGDAPDVSVSALFNNPVARGLV